MQNRLLPQGQKSALRAPRFKVVVAFDDNTSSSSALRTCDYVIRQLGGDVVVRRKVVDFNSAPTERRLAAAVKDAARADMVIVSTREQMDLSSPMRRWIDAWSGQRSTEEGALVALLNGVPAASERLRAQLASVAAQAHMDFFSSDLAKA